MSEPRSIEEFNKLVEESFLTKEKLDLIEDEEICPLKNRLKTIDGIILAQLEALDVNSYKSARGTVSRRRYYSVPTPKTIEDKQALFNWLESKGPEMFYQYVSVNSQSLNSLNNEMMENAKAEGDFDFSIPGVGAPTLQESVTRRRK